LSYSLDNLNLLVNAFKEMRKASARERRKAVAWIISLVFVIALQILFIYLVEPNKPKPPPIALRIEELTKALDNSVTLIADLEKEINGRQQKAQQLAKEVETREQVVKLTEPQMKAIKAVLTAEVKIERRRAFWQGLALNSLFFVLGSIVTVITSGFYRKFKQAKSKAKVEVSMNE